MARVISGYGPQECWSDEEKMPFFVSLEEEISKAQSAGKSIMIEIDANSKLGPAYIKRIQNHCHQMEKYCQVS